MKNIQTTITNDAAGEELIVQWHAAVETCKKVPNGFSVYEIKAIENFQHPEQLIDDLQKRQDQYLILDANEVFSRVSPFFRVLQDLVLVLQDALPRQVDSMKMVDGGAYMVLKNSVNSTWALNKIVDHLKEITKKLQNFEQYTNNQRQREIWRHGLTQVFISMLTIWTKSVRFLTRYAVDHKIKPNWPELNAAYEDALSAIRDVIEHVKEMNETAAATSNENMAELVSLVGTSYITDYEEECGSTFPVWNIPELQETVFLGRDDALMELDAYLNSASAQVKLRNAVISGMGGIGKSTVAAQYARLSREQTRYDAIFWIEAEKPSTLRKSFTTIAKNLEHLRCSDDDENNKMLVMKWLFKTKKSWLLIFDNVERVETLSEFLPHGCGSIIITTRSKFLAKEIKDARAFELTKLDFRQSLAAFNKFRCRFDEKADPAAEKVDTERLVRQLDGLALGIKQIATYIGTCQWTIRMYLEKYHIMAQEILKHETDATRHTLDTAWNVEFEDLQTKNLDAIKLLNILCLLNPDNIPIELLISDDQEDFCDPNYEVCEDEARVRSAVLYLHKVGLVTKDHEHVNIHRLLQSAFRYSKFGLSDRSNLQQALHAAAALLNSRFPNHEGNQHLYAVWKFCSLYLSSVLSLKAAFESAGKKKKQSLSSSPAFDRLLKNCCWYLYEAGHHYECLELLDFANRISLDKKSPTYGTLCQAYACTYFEINDLPKCRKWNEMCLEIRQRELETDDPDVANVHANLGNLLTAEGRYDDAIGELFMSLESLQQDIADDKVYIAMRLMMMGRAQFSKGLHGDQTDAESEYEKAEKTFNEADAMFLSCGLSGAFLHSFLSMDKGNLHLARGKFIDAREDYQKAHDKMFAVNPTSVMVGITQYKLAIAKIKLATATDYLEARDHLEGALISARYHRMEGQEARVCRAQAILFESDKSASQEEKERSVNLRKRAEDFKERVAKVNAGVLTSKPRDEDDEYDRLVCGYYR